MRCFEVFKPTIFFKSFKKLGFFSLGTNNDLFVQHCITTW
jgi:hypothetical protein